MLKKVVSVFFACLFFTGSTLLPLSDFSLMQDIPEMYHNYTRITTDDELSVIDFIGDYLLNGKQMFGHNAGDRVPNANHGVEYKHQGSLLNALVMPAHCHIIGIPDSLMEHTQCAISAPLSYYHHKIFRPPLA